MPEILDICQNLSVTCEDAAEQNIMLSTENVTFYTRPWKGVGVTEKLHTQEHSPRIIERMEASKLHTLTYFMITSIESLML